MDEDVAHGEAAEFVGLVGAGAGDEVGDDLVQLGVLAVGGGELAVSHAGAGAAHQHVADVRGGVAVEDQRAGLVPGAALLGDERGHLGRVVALQGAVGATDHPAGGDEQRARGRGEGDQHGDRLAPAEALLGDTRACPVGAERGGGEEGEAVDEGRGARPGGAVGQDGEDEAHQGDAPGGPDAELPLAAQQGGECGQDDADEHQAADRAGAARAGAEQVERGRGPGAELETGLLEEAEREQGQRPGRQDQQGGAELGQEARAVADEVAAAHGQQRDAQEQRDGPDDRGEGGGDRQEQGVRPGGAPAAAGSGGVREAAGRDARAGHQREQHGEDGGADAAAREGAGGGGQEGVDDGRPRAQEPGLDERAGREVGGEPGERDRGDQQDGDRDAGRAEEQRGEHRDEREVRRRGRGAAGANGVPGVQEAGPQFAGVARGGQHRAAGEGAAAEQVAAGDERDEQQDQEEHRAGLAGDALHARELLDLQEVRVVAAGS